ncbi:MAG: cytochrome C [endosymbiont of Galathealinum brachiosum]|uniref:Cytochrome C n=1 Tax=endosymbiont of Galathealinum brachiosum TaxID=2200906 RepID=A0A370DEW2_9GAMM|nr:MAG: cytochrome C [endosymbiont of Galathealinum brachiosum]
MKGLLAISAMVITTGFLSIPAVWSDSDFNWNKSSGVDAVTSPVYREECGSCHMSYPPGLLPEKSWALIMSGLEDHFGDNAELDDETGQIIKRFLVKNSADKSGYRKSHKFNRSIKSVDTPLRISEIDYFKHEHDEIPQRLVSGNEKVKSFSHCNACHSGAEQGKFNEDDINIPGYGQWDD